MFLFKNLLTTVLVFFVLLHSNHNLNWKKKQQQIFNQKLYYTRSIFTFLFPPYSYVYFSLFVVLPHILVSIINCQRSAQNLSGFCCSLHIKLQTKKTTQQKTLYTEEITKMKTKQEREVAVIKSEMEVIKAQVRYKIKFIFIIFYSIE